MVQGLELPVVAGEFGELGRGARTAVRLVTAWTALTVVLPVLRSVRRRLIWMALRAPGKRKLFTPAALVRRISERPWPMPQVRP
ncbi:hypothetical protein ACFZDK_28810 [Streptomyces sp. NPDC007901]|uniref:hypothetical protein n=1 Tax=Streptomyces sp. NPDC007901 TaxID=3364785 RepID=UPI0036E71305